MNSFDKCQKCNKYEKEIESLVYLKSELDKKYQEEKLRNKLIEKKFKTETTLSFNELNSTISTLKQDIFKKDVEIRHLKEKANEYKNKYDKTLSEMESEKNNFILNEEQKRLNNEKIMEEERKKKEEETKKREIKLKNISRRNEETMRKKIEDYNAKQEKILKLQEEQEEKKKKEALEFLKYKNIISKKEE